MLDIRFIRENPELVRENIKKKFQDAKLPLVDEVLELDEKKPKTAPPSPRRASCAPAATPSRSRSAC